MKKLKILFILLTTLLSITLAGVIKVTFDIKELNYFFIEEGKVVFTQYRPKGWTNISSIPKNIWGAIVVSEDWKFFDHHGVDFGELKAALIEALEGSRVRGASTITQQVVKNLFLTREKTITRKLKELVYTFLLEGAVKKEKILEYYLNLIQLGEDLYGLENGSVFYFEKHAKNLTPKEAAFLAMLLPSPIRYSVSFRDKVVSEFAASSVFNILNKMKVAKYIGPEELELYKTQAYSWESLEDFEAYEQ